MNRRLEFGMCVYRPFLIFSAVSAVAAGLAGCAPDTLPPTQGSAAIATPTTGGPLSGTPSPDLVKNDVSQDGEMSADVVRYECNDGTEISARYPNATTAIVDINGKNRPMNVAVSADGARYVGKSYEWWTKGSGPNASATLYTHRPDHSTGKMLAQCTEKN